MRSEQFLIKVLNNQPGLPSPHQYILPFCITTAFRIDCNHCKHYTAREKTREAGLKEIWNYLSLTSSEDTRKCHSFQIKIQLHGRLHCRLRICSNFGWVWQILNLRRAVLSTCDMIWCDEHRITHLPQEYLCYFVRYRLKHDWAYIC